MNRIVYLLEARFLRRTAHQDVKKATLQIAFFNNIVDTKIHVTPPMPV